MPRVYRSGKSPGGMLRPSLQAKVRVEATEVTGSQLSVADQAERLLDYEAIGDQPIDTPQYGKWLRWQLRLVRHPCMPYAGPTEKP